MDLAGMFPRYPPRMRAYLIWLSLAALPNHGILEPETDFRQHSIRLCP